MVSRIKNSLKGDNLYHRTNSMRVEALRMQMERNHKGYEIKILCQGTL